MYSHKKETDFDLFKIFTLVPAQFYTIKTTENLMSLESELKAFKIDLDVHGWLEEELLIPKII